MSTTFVTSFEVVDEDEEDTLHTEVHHSCSGLYELFSITQDCTDSDGTDTVLLHRSQLMQLAALAKGH